MDIETLAQQLKALASRVDLLEHHVKAAGIPYPEPEPEATALDPEGV